MQGKIMESMNYQFRDYEMRDHESLTKMILALYTEDPSSNVMTRAKIDRTIAVMEDGRTGKFIIAEVDGAIAGYALLSYYWSNEFGGRVVYIDELFTLPEFRNQGLGTLLMQYVFENAASAVAFALEVTPRNDKAKALYERMGFREWPNRHFIRGVARVR